MRQLSGQMDVGATHVSRVPECGWPLVCGFVERITYSHCAIRTTLRQLGLSQSLFQEVFAWLPDSSQELVDRGAISPSSSLPARSTRGFRRSAPSTSVSWPWIVPRTIRCQFIIGQFGVSSSLLLPLQGQFGPGRPGWSPTQAPHRSGLAHHAHPVPHLMNSRPARSVVVTWTWFRSQCTGS